ncbi:MAG TPA: hypothetical protein VEZ17_06810 [Chitinophagaceae bacterium]|jgi:regulation of enolase protein 1 (concanavalin A-like superfamily)|nr:hypothetical protein [Chitinophagaceae bacterium]
MKFLSVIALFFFYNITLGQSDSLGIFDGHADIGKPKLAGSATYDRVSHSYDLKGGGYNIWFNRDEFQYAYKKVKGDFTATANFQFKGDTGNSHRKIGWMIRQSTDADAVHVSAVSHGDGLTVLQWRTQKGENMKDPEGEIFFPERKFEVIQLQRIGKKITMRVGHVGEQLKTVGSHEMPNITDEALVGLFICSHNPGKVEEAKVWDVHLDKPAGR